MTRTRAASGSGKTSMPSTIPFGGEIIGKLIRSYGHTLQRDYVQRLYLGVPRNLLQLRNTVFLDTIEATVVGTGIEEN